MAWTRASPDWAAKLGHGAGALADYQLRAIEVLHDVAEPYEGRIADIRYVGIIGPVATRTRPTSQ